MKRKAREYMLSGRGQTWRINNKGEFYVSGRFSPTWRIFGISKLWNGSPTPWELVKAQADRGKAVEGYMHDIDHGTRRFWGGRWNGKLPKVRLWKA